MFDICIHCEMITIIKLINILTTSVTFFLMTQQISVYNTVLTIVIMLYIISLELTHPI